MVKNDMIDKLSQKLTNDDDEHSSEHSDTSTTFDNISGLVKNISSNNITGILDNITSVVKTIIPPASSCDSISSTIKNKKSNKHFKCIFNKRFTSVKVCDILIKNINVVNVIQIQRKSKTQHRLVFFFDSYKIYTQFYMNKYKQLSICLTELYDKLF
jgi:hypothetical protein